MWGRAGALALMLMQLPLSGDADGRQLGRIDPHVSATAVPLDRHDPARDRVGALHYRGGWVLRSRDSRFGGFSSLVVDGDRFLSVSDTGSTIRFRFDGRDVRDVVIGTLSQCPRTCTSKFDNDAESTTQAPDGTLWIGFENSNEIWRYDAGLGHAQAHVAPAAMKAWPANLGAESMVRLRDGRFLVIGENRNGPDHTHPVLLFAGDPIEHPDAIVTAGYRGPAGFDPSDATELPDGRILLLNRHVSLVEGFVSAITVFDPAEIAPGRVITGREIARLAPPLTVDNLEGVAAVRDGGETVLWMIADDNFMPFERTLLLWFTLDPASSDP